jgi:hypothetical protein
MVSRIAMSALGRRQRTISENTQSDPDHRQLDNARHCDLRRDTQSDSMRAPMP